MPDRHPLHIVHMVRPPLAAEFQRISDLAECQAAAGHRVGLLCDPSADNGDADREIERLRPALQLGISRSSDHEDLRRLRPSIVHAHGPWSGFFSRVSGTRKRWADRPLTRIYSPLGGQRSSVKPEMGLAQRLRERVFARRTDGMIFASRYERDQYRHAMGNSDVPAHVIYRSLSDEDFDIVSPRIDAADFLFFGAMDDVAGADLVLKALAEVRGHRRANARFIGSGPQTERFRQLAGELQLSDAVSFHEPMPIRAALALGRNVVAPSRDDRDAEIVLRAMAAGKPVLATNVGMIPEMFEDRADLLVPPGDVGALSRAMADMLAEGPAHRGHAQAGRQACRARFSTAAMTRDIEEAYSEFHAPMQADDRAMRALDTITAFAAQARGA